VNVHLVNPSSVSFGTAVIPPRWQYVIVAATPRTFGDPMLVDETLFQMDPDRIQQGGRHRDRYSYRKRFAWL